MAGLGAGLGADLTGGLERGGGVGEWVGAAGCWAVAFALSTGMGTSMDASVGARVGKAGGMGCGDVVLIRSRRPARKSTYASGLISFVYKSANSKIPDVNRAVWLGVLQSRWAEEEGKRRRDGYGEEERLRRSEY